MQNPQAAMSAMKAADMVVCLSAYKHNGLDYADVLLPVAPFTETSGTFVNSDGRAQSFKGAVKPLGEARPAWKVLRVLGNLLDVAGFNFETSEAVRDEALSAGVIADKLNNQIVAEIPLIPLLQRGEAQPGGFERVSDVPIYAADAVVRRASALQETQDAATPVALMAASELQKLGINSGDSVKVSQGTGSVVLTAVADDKLPAGTVRVAAGHAATAALGAMFGTINVERA
jgi:NADH-quinone oxidoreductase subunit G